MSTMIAAAFLLALEADLTTLTFAPSQKDVAVASIADASRQRLRRVDIGGLVVRPTGEGKLEVVWEKEGGAEGERARVDRVIALLGHRHALRFQLVSESRARALNVPAETDRLRAHLEQNPGSDPRALEIPPTDDIEHRWLPSDSDRNELGWTLCEFDATAVFTNEDLKQTYVTVDQSGAPAIGFTIRTDRAEAFGEFTETNVHRQLAIVLDGRVHTAPTLEGRIDKQGVIHGGGAGFTSDEVKELRLALSTPSLPCELTFEGIK